MMNSYFARPTVTMNVDVTVNFDGRTDTKLKKGETVTAKTAHEALVLNALVASGEAVEGSHDKSGGDPKATAKPKARKA